MRSVLVFDLDDTLYPEHSYVQSGLRVVGDYVQRQLGLASFADMAWELFQDGVRGHLFDQTLERVGATVEPELIQTLVQIYRAHRPQITLYEDAKWALDTYQKTRRLGLLTDGHLLSQRQKVEALHIAAMFRVIVYSDLYGRENWKPSATPYLRLMEELDCRRTDCVYIGDNAEKDFVTARKLGWYTVQIVRDGGVYRDVLAEPAYRAHYQITSLYQLRDIL